MTLRGKPGELGHLDAVGAVGGAGGDLVQEHHLALPFLHPHRGIVQAGQAGGERGQLVEMRGEQRAALIDVVQVLDRRPGDRQPVEGGGAAADLVQDDQRAAARLIEDGGGLHHLDHEGGAPARQIVGGADAREQPVDHADARELRRHERAHLGEDGDQRVLAQEGRFAGHVGAGDQPDAAGRLAFRRREIAVVGDEGRAVLRQRLLDHGMAAALDDEVERGIDMRAREVALGGKMGEAACHVEPAQAPRRRP